VRPEGIAVEHGDPAGAGLDEALALELAHDLRDGLAVEKIMFARSWYAKHTPVSVPNPFSSPKQRSPRF
jgi:hypothetical protein